MKEEIIPNGCVLLARQILDSEIWFKPSEYLKIFIYIVSKVNHKTNKHFPKGSNFFNFTTEINDIPGVTKNQIYDFIRWAKSVDMITTQKSTRGIILKLNNYEKYQDLDNYRIPKEPKENPDPKPSKFIKPTLEQVTKYCTERQNNINPEQFINYYESKGWMVGKSPMKSWKACIGTWESKDKQRNQSSGLF